MASRLDPLQQKVPLAPSAALWFINRFEKLER
jgi:hypothetical protein